MSIAETGRLPLFRIICIELFLVLLLSAFCLLFGSMMALSAFLGGLSSFVPNAYFALKFSRALDRGAGIGALVAGELGKLLLTTSIFVLVFLLVKDINYLLFFVAFALQLLIHILALYYIKAD